MTTRFRISHIAATTFLAFVVLTGPALTQGFGTTLKDGLGKAAPKELQGVSDPTVIVGNIVSSVIAVFGAALFVYLLWGGFKYMTAGGEASKVQEAKDTIKNAIIGIVIVALSFAIATFVIDRLVEATSGAQTVEGEAQ